MTSRASLRSRRAGAGLFAAIALVVSGSATAATAGTRPVVMLVGDSVPEQLEAAFDAGAHARGWDAVSAALGACPVTGEVPTKTDGTPVHINKDCPGVVSTQSSLIQRADPEVVLWWDRFDLHTFAIGDRVIVPGTNRFWKIRERRARAALDRLSVDGARVVFVGVEPPGLGIRTLCPNLDCRSDFLQSRIDRYKDIAIPWNRLLHEIADSRPHRAAFINVTRIVCHPIPLDRIPCNDKIDGVPARPDGTHYGGPGVPKVVNGLLDLVAPFMRAA